MKPIDMQQVTVRQLLEAGVHFGHQTRRWNPKMKKYIFGEKNGIYIINLELTLDCLMKGLDFLRKVAGEGKEILFVGTKKQAQELIKEAADRCKMPYVNNRWLGGMLTNFSTIRKSVARLDWIDQTEREGNFKFITKKEAVSLMKEREKLIRCLAGVRNMKKLPGALFIVDTKKEEIALREAIRLGIPTVALIDTNCDPDLVDFPIPGNDDSIRAIKLFCDLVVEAVNEGRNEYLKLYPSAAQEAEEEKEGQKGKTEQLAAGSGAYPLESAGAVSDFSEPTVEGADEEFSTPKAVEELEDKLLREKMEEEAKLKLKRPTRSKEINKKKS